MDQVGNYRIIEEIGSGGMGVVYLAEHVRLKRKVALKIIRDRYSMSQDHLARFKREAAVCASLNHPNVIKFYDFGQEEGTVYYAMELLDAETLKERISGGSPLERRDMFHVAKSLCRALDYIHSKNLVHRDIKPANIMIGSDGRVTLMDFGLVKAVDGTRLTRKGKTIGTPRYMSPEMLKADEVDLRSDIFQLGIVLYEAATGSPPFNGPDIYTVAAQVLSIRPRPPVELNPAIGNYLSNTIMNCLEKKKADRYQSAREVLGDIQRSEKNVPVPALAERRRMLAMTEDDTSGGHPGSTMDRDETARFTLDISDFSNLSTSVVALGKSVGVGPLLFGIVAAVILVVHLFLHSPSGGDTVSCAISGLRFLKDTDAVRVTWKSDEPYPSSIVYWKADGSSDRPPADAVEVNAGDEGSTDHSVDIRGLERKARYLFRLRLPGGNTSLTKALPVLHERELKLYAKETVRPSFDSLVLKFRTNVHCRCSLSYRVNESFQTLGEDGYGLDHSFTIKDIGPKSGIEELSARLQSLNHSKRVELGSLESPSKAVERLAEALSTFRGKAVIAELRHKKPKDGKTARRLLALAPEWRLYNKNSTLLATFFESWKVLPLDDVYPVYRAVRKIESVDQALDNHKFGYRFDIGSVYRDFIALDYAREWPAGADFVTVFSLSEAESSFVPDTAGAGSGTASGMLEIYGSSEDVALRKSFAAAAELTGFLERAAERPRLIIRVRNMVPAFHVSVAINGQWELDLFNTAESVPPELYLWDRNTAKKTVENEEYRKSVNYVSAAFPKGMLRPGINRFLVRLATYPGYATANWVQIRELRLYP